MGGRTQHTSDPAKMAACAASYSGHFLLEDDFDAVLAIIDGDILENDEGFLEQAVIVLIPLRSTYLIKSPVCLPQTRFS